MGKTVKLNFLIEQEVSSDLQEMVAAGGRSRLVNAAIKKELLVMKRARATEKLFKLRGDGPDVSMKEIVASIRSDRNR